MPSLVYPAYPQPADLQTFILSTGLITDVTTGAIGNVNWQVKCDAARQEMEQDTDRVFLPVTQTRYYNPPSNNKGILFVKDDILSITSMTCYGVAFIENTDFWLQPYNAGLLNDPYKRIEFSRRFFPTTSNADHRALIITGVFGFSQQIPAQVWHGVLCRAAWNMRTELALFRTRGLIESKAGDEMEMYAGRTGGTLVSMEAANWDAIYTQAVQAYKRVEVGL